MTDIGVLAELPADLGYLAEPALRFGRYQFETEICDFLDRATEAERGELAAVADRVRAGDHYPLVNAFLDESEMTDHEECVCLYFLFGVLDHAGLSFEPDTDPA